MMPAYGHGDSYPHQRYQMPFGQYHFPGFETTTPHIKMDPSKSPFAYEQPWPYAGHYGFPIPWNTCSGNNNCPGCYSYRHAYPHPHPHPHPPLSPIYCTGGCPAYPEVHPVPYALPPHYPMELPRYEYDKNVPNNYHCCGCPNHLCKQNEGKSLKIEEQKPDLDEKGSDSPVPVQWKNCPFPIIYSPPEHMNRKQKKPVNLDGTEQEKISCDAQPNGSSGANEQEPRVLNRWFPLEINSLPRLMQNGEKKTSQIQPSEDKRKEFPFPTFWMPYCDNQPEAGLANNTERSPTAKSVREAPHTFKLIPVSFSDDEGDPKKAILKEERSETNGDANVEDETTKQKSNPVKQMASHQEKNDFEGTEKRKRNIPVKQNEENVTDKNTPINAKRQSSPQKTSKLPPVCLRVDPLPRKKSSTRSSRSPSPSASKEHPQGMSNETSKASGLSGMKKKSEQDSQIQSPSSSNKVAEPNEKIIEMLDRRTGGNKGGDHGDVPQSKIPNTLSNGEHEEHENVSKMSRTEESEQKRKTLSDAEAAILIQSAYRGFEVRRWEPLKKLKQIAEVQEQAMDVRNCIQALDVGDEIQTDDKKKVIIGETIMRLLLKLDTIQGLHPSLRVIRKSLARELVSLQEKLDSIIAKKSNEQVHDQSTTKLEDFLLDAHNTGCVEEPQEEKEAVLCKKSSEDVFHDGHEILEQCQSELCETDTLCGSKDEELESVKQRPEHDNREPPVVDGMGSSAKPNLFIPSHADVSEVKVQDAHSSNTDILETGETVAEGEIKSEVGDTSSVDNLDVSGWEELPQEVNDDEYVDLDSQRDIQVEMGKNEVKLSVVSYMEPYTNLPAKDDDLVLKREQREISLAELPAGLVDEDYDISESKKNEECHMKKEILLREEEKCDSAIDASPPGDDISHEPHLKKQALGVQERQSNVKSDSWAKSECQKDRELFGDTSHDVEVEHLSVKEVKNDNELSILSRCTELQQLPSSVDHYSCVGANDLHSSYSQLDDSDTVANEKKHIVEDEHEEKVNQTVEEKEVQVEHQQLHPLIGDIQADQASVNEAQGEEEETLAGRQFPPLPEGVERELLVVPSDNSKSPNTEDEDGFDGKKLIEENKKLRELIEKLIEAGNNQLTVISNLNGRVKGLEKKLAKRKKMGTTHYRPATKGSSCIKSSNSMLQGYGVKVAM
ncbi:BAG family molecular chaperone regulator 6 [Quillaja saponaria]|uniref:BAG family molecular chaperone regulator 6 n=1 Tax=Quillaja saponaria TaxID=32244 RepID=A0AAD7PNN4_QUISA|nr:BAG family molecular chaperone regulator 6 [Quillaja saponaria]